MPGEAVQLVPERDIGSAVLSKFDTSDGGLQKTQRALVNILEDFDNERCLLQETQRITFNILEDVDDDRSRLYDTQRALLNILADLNHSKEQLKGAHEALEIRVKERTAELARSNAELEQFAYIASHDLQEPLRMVSSYVQLLHRRYSGRLDDDADEFINFAVEGAIRMQKLINDLLAYSRVGTQAKNFEPVSLERALAQALENLQVAVEERNAVVTHDPLPVAYGDSGQLAQVFQNLIDNATKFQGGKNTQVHVSAKVEQGQCICWVRDNGIGIAPEHRDKLFLLFQRLHTRKQYPGTGIGLAICKRIVERHGGRIWVDSEPGQGSTFYFTIRVWEGASRGARVG